MADSARLKTTTQKPTPDDVKKVLDSHDEALVICVDNSGNESDIVIFSKTLKEGVLAAYLIELLKNLEKTSKSNATTEKPHSDLKGTPTAYTEADSCKSPA